MENENTKRNFAPDPVYCEREEILSSASHAAGAVLCAMMTAVLLYLCPKDPVSVLSICAFGACAFALYLISSLYHAKDEGRGKRILRVADHCTIFLLIAGTYTPYCLIALAGSAYSLPMLIAEWCLAAVGIVLNALAMRNKIVKGVSMALYVVMGWMIVLAMGDLLASLTFAELWLLISGGIAYTVGIVFYALGKRVRYCHFVWHIFDILGTALQFFALFSLLA